jgi:hypothetical protein
MSVLLSTRDMAGNPSYSTPQRGHVFIFIPYLIWLSSLLSCSGHIVLLEELCGVAVFKYLFLCTMSTAITAISTVTAATISTC